MIRRLPPLRSLEAFIRVVRAGSAKTAAAELALSPSALSRRLGALEDFVGKALFERKHQMLKLTEEGQHLYDAVAPLMDEMTDRIDRLVDTGKVMRLRLGVLPLFGSQRLFRAWASCASCTRSCISTSTARTPPKPSWAIPSTRRSC
jgi:DNA-binding transcriptional LysR family regulator